jgi:hypothetical protein
VPFKSKAQQRFMFAEHPDIAKRWAAETPNIKDAHRADRAQAAQAREAAQVA